MSLDFMLALLLLTATPTAAGIAAPAPPMVDGDCADYAALQARSVPMTDGVTLHIHQDRHYVWLCYDYPAGSDGTLDLQVESPALPEALNLHVSASLGEWPANRPELAPQSPDSTTWWNNRGWIANTVLIRNASIVDGRLRFAFQNAGARELQLDKRRFGEQGLRVKFHVRRIRNDDGSYRELRFPADDGWLAI